MPSHEFLLTSSSCIAFVGISIANVDKLLSLLFTRLTTLEPLDLSQPWD